MPVELTTRVPLSGYRTVVENLVRLHELDSEGLGNDRALNLPGLDVTGQEMEAGLRTRRAERLAPSLCGPTRPS